LTAPDAGANFGVVVTFRLDLLVALEELEVPALDELLLDEPQPASAVRAAHAASARRRVLICTSTLA